MPLNPHETPLSPLSELVLSSIGAVEFRYGEPASGGNADCSFCLGVRSFPEGEQYIGVLICDMLPSDEAEQITWELIDEHERVMISRRFDRRGVIKFPVYEAGIPKGARCWISFSPVAVLEQSRPWAAGGRFVYAYFSDEIPEEEKFEIRTHKTHHVGDCEITVAELDAPETREQFERLTTALQCSWNKSLESDEEDEEHQAFDSENELIELLVEKFGLSRTEIASAHAFSTIIERIAGTAAQIQLDELRKEVEDVKSRVNGSGIPLSAAQMAACRHLTEIDVANLEVCRGRFAYQILDSFCSQELALRQFTRMPEPKDCRRLYDIARQRMRDGLYPPIIYAAMTGITGVLRGQKSGIVCASRMDTEIREWLDSFSKLRIGKSTFVKQLQHDARLKPQAHFPEIARGTLHKYLDGSSEAEIGAQMDRVSEKVDWQRFLKAKLTEHRRLSTDHQPALSMQLCEAGLKQDWACPDELLECGERLETEGLVGAKIAAGLLAQEYLTKRTERIVKRYSLVEAEF